mmetsp:Transcript_8417/g.16512  ORF Transcript_8417/g.16512 Transcript_8417/m.16512 type:complete len:140 (-) Transcript_8417:102-521(-)
MLRANRQLLRYIAESNRAVLFVSNHPDPYGSSIRLSAKACGQEYICARGWKAGAITNRAMQGRLIGNFRKPPSLILAFGDHPGLFKEARSLCIPVVGCFSKDPKKGAVSAAYYSTLLQGYSNHRNMISQKLSRKGTNVL